MADAEAVMAAVPRRDDVSYIGLVLNRRGLDRALDTGVDEINVVVPVTDTFCERNQGCSTGDMLDAWDDIAGAAGAGVRKSVTISVAFGCPFEGETPSERVVWAAQRAYEAGADEIAIADTIGVGVPRQVRDLTRRAREAAPGVSLRFHFHNTRNTGYANALAAVEEGIDVLDASTGGFGGCPFAPAATGNIATEDLIYGLRRSGVETEVSMEAVTGNADWLGKRLGKRPEALLGRAGGFPPADRPTSAAGPRNSR
jgi:hydroxymethylglutaryl-CoA lyase